jgi:queuosine precursor transporter
VRSGILIAVAAMVFVVALANYAVQFPLNDWLTWGAFTYPVAFLITDLSNRAFGPARARRVVYAGFVLAVALSIWLATPRIAVASGVAFLAAQLWDVAIFNRLRHQDWWRAPLASSVLASALDTALFFSVAFAGTGLPWTTWAIGDYAVKLGVAAVMLIPFGALRLWIRPWTGQQPAGQQQS